MTTLFLDTYVVELECFLCGVKPIGMNTNQYRNMPSFFGLVYSAGITQCPLWLCSSQTRTPQMAGWVIFVICFPYAIVWVLVERNVCGNEMPCQCRGMKTSMPSLVSCFHISEGSLCVLHKIAQNMLMGYGKCLCMWFMQWIINSQRKCSLI